jgi:hypothetical protein
VYVLDAAPPVRSSLRSSFLPQVMLGWGPVLDDGCTFCPVCGERFLAMLRFRVWFASGDVVDDSCVYMSPALVRCQLEASIARVTHDGGSGLLSVLAILDLAPNLYISAPTTRVALSCCRVTPCF